MGHHVVYIGGADTISYHSQERCVCIYINMDNSHLLRRDHTWSYLDLGRSEILVTGAGPDRRSERVLGPALVSEILRIGGHA